MSIERVEVDLGASGTRMCQKKGIIDTIPNNMVFVGMEDVVDLRPYDDNILNNLEVKITKEGAESEMFPCHVLIGSLAERYSPSNERPSVAANKLSQRVNYVSVIVAMAYMNVKYEMGNELHLYMALPPVEVKNGKQIANENIAGKYKVEFVKLMGGKSVEFEVKTVSVHEESYLALMSFLFTREGKLREENKECLKGYTLSVDIGASTSDLGITKDGKYLEKSGKTYKTGGNVAREYLVDSIREEFGYDLPVEEAEVVMSEGRLKIGATYRQVTDYVESAKKHLADELIGLIMTYFRQVNIPIQMISNIVVSGGGSLESYYTDDNDEEIITSRPTSQFLTDKIHEICKEVNVIYYGKKARLANITGLFIQACMEEIISNRNQ